MERAVRNLVGPILRKIRTDKAMSQAELATQCQVKGWDVSRDIIASIEDQSRAVTEIEIVFLAYTLNVEVTELMPSKKVVVTAARKLFDDDEKPVRKRKRWFGI